MRCFASGVRSWDTVIERANDAPETPRTSDGEVAALLLQEPEYCYEERKKES